MAADNSLTKKSHIKQQWSEQQISDLQKCMDPDTGYMFFAKNFFHIQSKNGQTLFKPYDFQEKLLQSYHEHTHIVALLSRQVGKCVMHQSLINIKNKITGEEMEISIGDFYNMQAIQRTI